MDVARRMMGRNGMVNIKQVAREAGVSTATVSRVLNGSGYASKEARRRVLDAIERLNYRPSAIARSLKTDKTGTIGILVPDISNPYFMQISRGIEHAVQTEGYHLIFASTDEDPRKEAHLLNLFAEQRVDVIVLAASSLSIREIRQVMEAGIHVILVDRRLPGVPMDLDMFLEDNAAASRQLTERLIEAGHERIAVIHGGFSVSTSVERLAGFREAMDRHGLSVDERLLFDGRFSEEGGMAAVRAWLEAAPKPTAILALNNKMAFGAALQLHESGMRIPDDVALASYGEVDAFRLLKGARLWCVRQKPHEMGQAIGKRILAVQKDATLMRNKTERLFVPEIVRHG